MNRPSPPPLTPRRQGPLSHLLSLTLTCGHAFSPPHLTSTLSCRSANHTSRTLLSWCLTASQQLLDPAHTGPLPSALSVAASTPPLAPCQVHTTCPLLCKSAAQSPGEPQDPYALPRGHQHPYVLLRGRRACCPPRYIPHTRTHTRPPPRAGRIHLPVSSSTAVPATARAPAQA